MIYIAKDLEEQVDKEPNVSGLINSLLAEHFKKVLQKKADFATVGIRSEVKHDFQENKLVSTVTPNDKDIKKFQKKIKLCKHGWPLGECLDKGKDRSCMP